MGEPNHCGEPVSDFRPNPNLTADEQAAQLANFRAMAWACSAPGTPYGGTEAVPAVPRSGTAPDPPDQGIPRLRGGDACG